MGRGIRSWQQDGLAEKTLEFGNLFLQYVDILTGANWKGYFRLRGGIKPIPTAYLQANPQLAGVSSSLLRRRIKDNEDISNIVPTGCAALVADAYRYHEANTKPDEK